MSLGIRAKIVLLTTGIMGIAVAAIILASSHYFVEAYAEALQSRSLAVGKSLKLQLDRLFQLGIRLEELTGFDEQCRDVVNQYEGMRYAMVTDEEGRILFHNNPSKVGGSLEDKALLQGVKSSRDIVVHSDTDLGGEEYTAFIPVPDPAGNRIAVVEIGFSADIIHTKMREAALFSVKVGLFFLMAAVITLLASISVFVTRPLTGLLAVIQEMRDRGEVVTRKVTIGARDEIGQLVQTFNMMTEKLQNTTVSRDVLQYQATHDELTGLPNRSLLADRLEQAILIARRHGRQLAVLFVDLDNFKLINDSLGHDTGDAVLKTIAGRLQEAVRSSDTVSRQAGDEFVIILPDLQASENAAVVARKIIEGVARPMMLADHDLSVTCSIGISAFPKDGESVSELLKNADTALYRTKEQGKDGFQFFTPEMNARLYERVQMERELRRALEQEEFVLYYQPKVSLHTGQIVGMESLIRWQHPQRGIVSPGEFISLAEETGLIAPIGKWVLRTACLQAKAWQEAGLPRLPVAVNVSVRQFKSDMLIAEVSRAIHDAGVDPAIVELEVTESLLMLDTARVQSILGGLKDLGLCLTMDDFGTGYSSLGYLKRFPFDKLKLDISFVRDIIYDPDSAAIALAVIGMAHSLNLKVIAEGVETEGQMSYLRLHGCDEMQGYYFSRPLPAAEFERLVRERHSLPMAPLSAEGPGRTLLIIDDDAKVLSALRRILRADGYRILTATGVAEAFELLARNRVGIIVADHYMPDMTGIEFLKRVRSLYPECIRIMLTGHADLDTVTEAVNRGFVFKFLSKPWDDDHFKEVIHEAFRQYALVYREAA